MHGCQDHNSVRKQSWFKRLVCPRSQLNILDQRCRDRKHIWRLGSLRRFMAYGANRNTLITFSDDVTVSGQPLSKGTYALYSIPKQDVWMVYFYNETNNWGTPSTWDEDQVSLAVRAKVQTIAHAEVTFHITQGI